jgi:Family of unknown function (DUF6081)
VTVRAASRAVVYDDFMGTDIDEGRWRYLTLPGTDDGGDVAWTCFEPTAETRVGEGTLDMYVPRFSPRHRSIQVFDNLTHQLVSQEAFSTDSGAVRFTLDMAATRAGDAPADFRDGFASFMLIDTASGWSFRVCSTGHSTFGLYDSLRLAYHSKKSTQVIDSPVSAPVIVGGSLRHEIVVDRDQNNLEWWVDGHLAARIDDPSIPRRVHIALGLATLMSVEPSREMPLRLAAPGLSVSFGPVSVEANPVRIASCDGKKSA